MLDQDQFLSALRKSNIILDVDHDGALSIEAPKGVLTDAIIEQIKIRKQDLLVYLQGGKGQRAMPGEIRPVATAASYPLSSSQLRLWMVHELDSQSVAYNIPVILTLSFPQTIDIEKYRQAVAAVIQRHEILRTVFKKDEAGEVRQWVLERDAIDGDILYIDLKEIAQPRAEANKYIERDKQLPFDLSAGPLLRGMLFRLSATQYLFYYNMHHIISDGWSMELLSKEVFVFYNALLNNREPELPPLSIQYKDYAVWQQQEVRSGSLQGHKAYWLQQLGGELPLLALPEDKPRPLVLTANGHALATVIGPAILEPLRQFCADNQATLFMGLLSTLNVLFYRYTGQEDIIIGSPIAGRQQGELEHQIGFYLNVLALRSRFSGRDSFKTLLQQVRRETLAAYEHQAYPFDHLVGELELKRIPGRSVLLDVMMVLQNQRHQDTEDNFFGNQEGIIDEGPVSVKLDLNIDFFEVNNGLCMRLFYNSDIYEKDTAARFMQHYISLLKLLVQQPQAAINRIDYLTATEKDWLLQASGINTAFQMPVKTVTELFEEQVDAVPDHIALIYEEQAVSFRQLDELSNRMANYLIDRGIEKGSVIPLCLDRSIEMMVTILGLLKAGYAYVPIDPAYPEERIRYMVRDSAAGLIIANRKYQTLFTTGEKPAVLVIEDHWEAINHYSAERLPAKPGPNSVAYIMYTSGSTGHPKGVVIEHAALSNYLHWVKQEYLSDPDGGNMGLYSSLSFDLTVTSLFGTLIRGTRLVIFPASMMVDEIFAAYLQGDQGLDVIKMTPAHSSLLEFIDPHACTIRKVIIGGEALRTKQVQALLALNKDLVIYNEYGPTESTVGCIVAAIRSEEERITIGRPIPGTTAFILDEQGNLVPPGVSGELYLGGVQLARGYWNKEALTAERFIDNPFTQNERLYKTGDMARWLPDGALDYINRKDDQVKIRGYRIELGEIEQALLQLSGIDSAVVIAQDDHAGNKFLAAYITSEQEQDMALLQQQLRSRLPEYMVPASILQPTRLPLTLNGKVDKKALQLSVTAAMPAAYLAPGSPLELSIAAIWQEVLLRDVPLSVNDDFFLHGGHSLRVMQLLNSYHKILDVKLSMLELFQHTTIAAQAALIKGRQAAPYIPIERAAEANDYPVSAGQWRLWVLSQRAEVSQAYKMIGQLPLVGEQDPQLLEQAIQMVIERHEILRTVFRENETGELRQVILSTAELNFRMEYADLEHADQAQKDMYWQQEGFAFDLAHGPLLHAALVKLSPGNYLFNYCMHHIISDGWSMELMYKEIAGYYNGLMNGVAHRLPPLRIQYKDFASWQARELEGEGFREHRKFWLSQFEGELPVLELPAAFPRPARITYNGRRFSSVISAAHTTKLRDLCRRQQATLFMGLVSVLKTLFHRYTHQSDIIIGTSVAGRKDAELENQIGFYLNTLALRTSLSDRDSFEELLVKIRNSTLLAYEYQAYPFDRLIEEVQITQGGSRSPLFDVLVLLQNYQATTAQEGTDAEVDETAIVDDGPVAAKYDLTVLFYEIGSSLRMELSFNSDIYSKEGMERLMLHFKQLLAAATAQPEKEIGLLDYLPAAEKQNLLAGANNSRVDFPEQTSVISLFSIQAAKTPSHTAVVFNDAHLTYQELDELSNQLAHYIRSKGIGKEDKVVVSTEKSLELVVSILGIMKSGAAFVPVNPSLPADRILYMLEDTACKMIIAGDEMQHAKTPDNEALWFDWALDKGFIDAMPSTAVTERILPEQLLYIIYTSGSTGRPKGVMIENRSFVNHLYGMMNSSSVAACRSFALPVNLASDSNQSILFIGLLTGGAVHVISDALLFDGIALGDYFSQYQIECLKIFPSLWAAYGNNNIVPLKCLIFGGEVLPPTVVDQLQQMNYQGDVYNHYGPTEVTIGVIMHKVDLHYPYYKVPLGVPYSNTCLYVLDHRLQPCPVGVVGELYIGGKGVARGYLNNAGLTREKFIHDPFLQSGRIYCTGDLVRWTEEGNIEYLGRKDDQLKIRGYRIELGEIEFALLRVPGIDAAVAVSLQEGSNLYIIAYITSPQPQDNTVLRQQLGDLLPDYLVPAFIIQVDEIPLSPNGKVNKKALPVPDFTHTAGEMGSQLPRNIIEARIGEIWQEVLNSPMPIGVTENFFAHGGHSLRVIRLMNAYHRLFQVKVSMQQLFEHTTIAAHAALINSQVRISYAPVSKAAEADDYPVSDGQLRLWVLSQKEESSRSYNTRSQLLLKGPKVQPGLLYAIQQVVERHEILRTVFRQNNEGAVRQVVIPMQDFHVDLYEEDFSGRPYELIKAHIDREAAQIFDLEKGPLLKVGLLHIGDHRYMFYYIKHHIISDAASIEVLERELLHYYSSFINEVQQELAPLHIQYKDYAVWQQGMLAGDNYKQHQTWWLQQFSGELPVFELPASRPRPAVFSYNGYSLSILLDRASTDGLRALCRRQQGTLFMGLLTVLKALLYNYTGQDDIIVGTPVSGREHADLEHQIGFYLNTLALRTQFKGNDSFNELLQRVRAMMVSAYDHQSYPFDRLVRELEVKRDPSRSVLFDIMVVSQNQTDSTHRMPGNQVTDEGEESAKFDLMVDFQEHADSVHIKINFNRDIYDRELITQLLLHYRNFVRSVVSHPSIPISQVDYLTGEEKQQLLERFNQTARQYDLSKTIVDLFTEQATKTPGEEAIWFEGISINYGELEKRSDSLAYKLDEAGVAEGCFVPLLMSRGIDFAVAFLAVLKTGAAVVPLSINWPVRRLQLLLSEIASPVVLLNEEGLRRSELSPANNFLVVDHEALTDDRLFVARAHVAAPIYMFYTSGSTGMPKGVVVPHKGILNRFLWMNDYFGAQAARSVLRTTRHIFDSSVWQLFWPLINGGKCIIPSEKQAFGLEYFTELVRDHQVSMTDFIPSLFNEFVSEMRENNTQYDIGSLREIVIGGEEIHVSSANYFRKAFPGIRLTNLYGPTEASIGCVYHALTDHDYTKIPIGRPISNTRIYITNPGGNLLPVNVTGEIMIAGIGLANGYYGDKVRTAERFIRNPFVNRDEGDIYSRLYHTGDLGRWLPDGTIEYRGRADAQVKVRGYRIELGEIEHALLQLSDVDTVVAGVRNDHLGRACIMAWFTSAQNTDTASIRQQLMKYLPDYMMPSYFIRMEQLPLTDGGKVNKKALPDPSSIEDMDDAVVYTAPSNTQEKLLLECCEKVLKREVPGGIKGSFFEAGGDSIKAIMLASRLKQQGIQVKVTDILEFPVIEILATKLQMGATQVAGVGSEQGDVPLTPVQARFFNKANQNKHHYNQSVLLYSKSRMAKAVVDKCLQELTRHHDALRMRYQQENGHWIQYNRPVEDNLYYLEEHDLIAEGTPLIAMGQACERLQASIDLQQGPLLKAAIFHAPDGDRFLLVVHHLVVDGVSWRILLEDLSTLYSQLEKGAPVQLPAKSDSFRQWALQLRQYAAGDLLSKELSYWTGIARQPVRDVQPDFSDGANLISDAVAMELSLDKELTGLLLTRVNTIYQTEINDILLTGLLLAVREVFALDKVMIALEGHGREEVVKSLSIGRTVGWFTTVYPVLLESEEGNDWVKTLLKVKKCLRGIPNKGIGFGILRHLREPAVEELRLMPDPSIMFNYLGDFGSGVSGDTGEEVFSYVNEYKGSEVDTGNRRDSILAISGLIVNGSLRFNIQYSKQQFRSGTMERLASTYQQWLEGMIKDLCERQPGRKVQAYPLSYNQQSYARDGSVAHAQDVIAFEIDHFDQERFTAAYKQLIADIPVLRMRIYQAENGWLQQVLPPGQWPDTLQIITGGALGMEDPAIVALGTTMINKPFDLDKGEVIRCGVFHKEGRAHVLLIIHHIVTDGYSNALLKKYLLNRYAGNNIASEHRSDYLHYVQVQEDYLQLGEAREKLTYWESQLRHIAAQNNHQNAIEQSAALQEFITASWVISGPLYKQVLDYCKKQKILLSSFLLTAFRLFNHSERPGQEALLLGVVVNGRDVALPGFAIGEAIGQFVNTLPLVFTHDSNSSFAEAIRHTQQAYLEGRQHQEIPLAIIDSSFRRQSGKSIYACLHAEFNYTDRSGQGMPAGTGTSIKKTKAGTGERRYYWGAQCSEYQDGIHMEWKGWCAPAQAATNYYTEKMEHIIRCIVNTPGGPVTMSAIHHHKNLL
ncbi:non-ribosomal peptide synthetase [Paraflavitalea soli]|nr:non-ribosomal peptide synthetase [Paraflavitalea soli]